MADDRGRQPAPSAGTLLGVGSVFGVCVGIGAFVGVLLDHQLGTSPLLALLGVLVGILAGATGAYQIIRPYVASTTATRTNPHDQSRN